MHSVFFALSIRNRLEKEYSLLHKNDMIKNCNSTAYPWRAVGLMKLNTRETVGARGMERKSGEMHCFSTSSS